MTNIMRYALTVAGAGALAASAMTTAVASHPSPIRTLVRTHVHHTTVDGALTVTNVLRVQNNSSVYGHLYAHNGAQVWKTLTVRNGGLSVLSGGVKSDSLDVSGPLQAQQITASGNLQAGAISGASLSLAGAATVGGTLTASGKLSANGIDAGSGGVNTAGRIAGNGVDGGSGGVSTIGAINGGSLTTSGGITSGGKITASGLVVSGNVDFSAANVTGLSLANLNLRTATLQTLNLGLQSNSNAPLTLNENGQSAPVGVDQNGFLTARGLSLGASGGSFGTVLSLTANGQTSQIGVDANGNATFNKGIVVNGTLTAANFSLGATTNLTIGGGLTVAGAQGIVASNLQAPTPSGSSTPGPLTLQGSTVTVTGNLSIAGGDNLNLSIANSGGALEASHVVSNGDTDVAGVAQVTVGTNGQGIATVIFQQAYSSQPTVTVTAASDPSPGTTIAPKVWVTLSSSSSGGATGFVIHYASSNAPANPFNVQYAYHVIG